MQVVCGFAIYPVGTDKASLRPYVDTCTRVLQKHGLVFQVNPTETTIAGSWSDVSKAVEECIQAVQRQGCPRVESVLRICSRTDKDDFVDKAMGQLKPKEQ